MADRISNWQRQAWLTEYQVLQQATNGNVQSYWTLSGIFIGINSVLLGGLMYGILSNTFNVSAQINVLSVRLMTTGIGSGIIIILIFLRLWLARVNYLAERRNERMCEIEIDLGMWNSLRRKAISTWNKQKLGSFKQLPDIKIDELWNKIKKELGKGISVRHRIELEQVKKELIDWCNTCNRDSPQSWYTSPSRILHYNALLFILSLLWVLVIINVWFIN